VATLRSTAEPCLKEAKGEDRAGSGLGPALAELAPPHPVNPSPRLAGRDPPSGRGAKGGYSPGLARGAQVHWLLVVALPSRSVPAPWWTWAGGGLTPPPSSSRALGTVGSAHGRDGRANARRVTATDGRPGSSGERRRWAVPRTLDCRSHPGRGQPEPAGHRGRLPPPPPGRHHPPIPPARRDLRGTIRPIGSRPAGPLICWPGLAPSGCSDRGRLQPRWSGPAEAGEWPPQLGDSGSDPPAYPTTWRRSERCSSREADGRSPSGH